MDESEVRTRILRHVDSPEGPKAREGCDPSQEAHRSVRTTLIAEAGLRARALTDCPAIDLGTGRPARRGLGCVEHADAEVRQWRPLPTPR